MALMAFPLPAAGESVAGYFFRLAEANGFHNPDHLYEAEFGREVYRYNRISVEDLCKMTSHPPEVFDHLWLTYADTYYTFRDVVIPLNQICEKDDRWCPACWRRDAIIPSAWQVGWMPICHVHETLLLDACPACGGKIRYKNHAVTCKKCDLFLEEMDAGYSACRCTCLSASDIRQDLGADYTEGLLQEPRRKAHRRDVKYRGG